MGKGKGKGKWKGWRKWERKWTKKMKKMKKKEKKGKGKLPGNGNGNGTSVLENPRLLRLFNTCKRIQGFDIKLKSRGYIIPYYLEGRFKEIAIRNGKIGVEYYNNEVQKTKAGVMLTFVKPLKINGLFSSTGHPGYHYYITLEAKDAGAPDHQSRIYQTLVYAGFGISITKVLIFRLKPQTTPTPPSEKCCAKNLEESQEEYISMSGSNDESDKICNP